MIPQAVLPGRPGPVSSFAAPASTDPHPAYRPDPTAWGPPRSQKGRVRMSLLPPGSDFWGWVYLTLPEAVVDLKPVEPWYPRVDLLGLQLGRQVLVMLPQSACIRSVVVRD